MKGKTILLVSLLLLLTALLGAGDRNHTGILIDTLCGETAAHNSEKVAHHTVACSLMENCQASGFGIVFDRVFFKFDERGDELALELLKKTALKRRLAVRVWGDFDFQEETVRVSRLETASED